MSFDPRRYARPGDPVRLAASQVNGLNELLSRPKRAEPPAVPQIERPYTWCHARNDSAATILRGRPAAITGLLQDINTTAGEASYYSSPCLSIRYGHNNEISNSLGTPWPIAIAIEPIASGRVGRVAVSGLVQADVDIRSDRHTYAYLSRDNAATLTSGNGGDCEIVYRPPTGPTTRKCLVRLGQAHQGLQWGVFGPAAWNRNTTAEVRVLGEPGNTQHVYNFLYDVPGRPNTSRTCIIAPIPFINPSVDEGQYCLISYEC